MTNLFSKGRKNEKKVPKQTKTKKEEKTKTQFRHKTKQFCHKRKEKKNHSGTTTNQSMKCLMGEPAVNHWGTVGTTPKEHVLTWFPKMGTCS